METVFSGFLVHFSKLHSASVDPSPMLIINISEILKENNLEMLFYLDSRGESIQEYLAREGNYIGSVGTEESTLKKSDISLENIIAKQNEDQFLVCCVMNGAWWVAVLFNTPEGAAELKAKYKGKPMLWYWVTRENIEYCLHHIQMKYFNLEFPKKQSELDNDVAEDNI